MGLYGSDRLLAEEKASGVLGDGFQCVVASVEPPARVPDHQRLFGEPLEQPQHIFCLNAPAAGSDLLDGGQGRASAEDAQQSEQGLFLLRQQAVTPVERRAHGSLPVREVARARRLDLIQPFHKRLRREQSQVRRGQLDGKRYSSQPATQLPEGLHVTIGERQVRHLEGLVEHEGAGGGARKRVDR
jgi:hypothetical protein